MLSGTTIAQIKNISFLLHNAMPITLEESRIWKLLSDRRFDANNFWL